VLLLLDLLFDILDWAVRRIGIGPANWISFGTMAAIGACCLALGSPGWAALAFGAAAIDAWELKQGGYSDGR
jgi:hypothetical protein